MKWKEPASISADFRLGNDSKHNPSEGKLRGGRHSQFSLLVWLGGDEYAYYADLKVQDDEQDV